MNETRRTPTTTTGRQSPSLFDKWHGTFYMPSRIDEAGHTKAVDYPVAEHWGKAHAYEASVHAASGTPHWASIRKMLQLQSSRDDIAPTSKVQSLIRKGH